MYPPPASALSFLIIGHRGSPRSAPESSLDSFRKAFAEGADAVETDLRQLVDGTIVLHHDEMIGTRRVEGLTWNDLRREAPASATLQDLLEAFPDGQLLLEVKKSGWEGALLRAIESNAHRIVVSSFDHRVIAGLPPAIPRGALINGYLMEMAGYAGRLGASWLYPRQDFVDEALVRDCRTRGIAVAPWTTNEPEQWQWFRSIGCQGIITDIPGAAAEWRKGL
jgi:glycerophosphoryl diester phosphodiesterase